MKQLAYMTMAALVGVAVALQGVLNARLREGWGLGLAIFFNVLLTVPLSLLLWGALGFSWPGKERILQTPWPLLLGGVMGFYIITAGAMVFGRLPATVALALVLLGQFTTALLVDANGWLGMPRVPVSPSRLAGLALLGLGVWLMRR